MIRRVSAPVIQPSTTHGGRNSSNHDQEQLLRQINQQLNALKQENNELKRRVEALERRR